MDKGELLQKTKPELLEIAYKFGYRGLQLKKKSEIVEAIMSSEPLVPKKRGRTPKSKIVESTTQIQATDRQSDDRKSEEQKSEPIKKATRRTKTKNTSAQVDSALEPKLNKANQIGKEPEKLTNTPDLEQTNANTKPRKVGRPRKIKHDNAVNNDNSKPEDLEIDLTAKVISDAELEAEEYGAKDEHTFTILDDPDFIKDESEENSEEIQSLEAQDDDKKDQGERVVGILEITDKDYGFLRVDTTMSSPLDCYVAHSLIKRFNLRSGDEITGFAKKNTPSDRYRGITFVENCNGEPIISRHRYKKFDELTPLFPKERFNLETDSKNKAMRIVDLFTPIGKGQRGLIVAPPKSGKTVLLKNIAKSIRHNYPEVKLMVLLIDERPEEVTDMKDSIDAPVFASTFDQLAQNHVNVAELVISRAKILVEMGHDVVIVLDSITRLARAYNIVEPMSGKLLSGGIDTAALHKPKRFLGAARNTKEAGSLTILATALIETGSRMDDVIFEEFKGTGNMELILDRKLSERRIFPSIDIRKSGTRKEETLYTAEELLAVYKIRQNIDRYTSGDDYEKIFSSIMKTENNDEFIRRVLKDKNNL